MSDVASDSLRRLHWRCRRGMKELDLVLERFLNERYVNAAADQQHAFEILLEQEDPLLWRWLVGAETPPVGAVGDIVQQMRNWRSA